MEYFIGEINIGNFLRSRDQFKKYRKNLTGEQEKA